MAYRSIGNFDEGDLHTGTRVCRVCAIRRPMPEFFWASGGKYRFRSCKTCFVSKARVRREETREESRESKRAHHLRRKYGLTSGCYDAMWKSQDGRCAICNEHLEESAAVDHDHKTGAVRGILCFTCNTALGKFRDSEEILLSAIAYLRKPPPNIKGRPKELSPDELMESRRSRRKKAAPAWNASRSASGAIILTSNQREEVRRRYATGTITQATLSAEYGCSQSAISRITKETVNA